MRDRINYGSSFLSVREIYSSFNENKYVLKGEQKKMEKRAYYSNVCEECGVQECGGAYMIVSIIGHLESIITRVKHIFNE